MEDVAELTAKRAAFEPAKQAVGKAKADALATAHPERLGRWDEIVNRFTPRILVEGLGNPPLLALAALRIREA